MYLIQPVFRKAFAQLIVNLYSLSSITLYTISCANAFRETGCITILAKIDIDRQIILFYLNMTFLTSTPPRTVRGPEPKMAYLRMEGTFSYRV